MPFDKSTKSGPERDRRMFQKLQAGVGGFLFGDGVSYDPATSTISIDIAANKGLEIISGQLAVNVDENFGLSLNSSGIRIDLATISGLEFSSGDLRIDVGQSPSVLAIDSTGLITQYLTVSGSAGSVSALLTCDNNAAATVQMSHAASGSGRFMATNSEARMGLKSGTSVKPGIFVGAAKTIVQLGSLSTAFQIVENGSTSIFELATSGTSLVGFADIVVQPPDNAGSGYFCAIAAGNSNSSGDGGPMSMTGGNAAGTGTGGLLLFQSGNAAGVNRSAGTLEYRAGMPTGSGASPIQLRVTDNTGTLYTVIECGIVASGTSSKLGFFAATPIARPGTYTITAAPAVATALDADANGGVAYSATPLALINAATLADLNDARTDIASLSAVLRQLIKHLGDTSGLGLINETSY